MEELTEAWSALATLMPWSLLLNAFMMYVGFLDYSNSKGISFEFMYFVLLIVLHIAVIGE